MKLAIAVLGLALLAQLASAYPGNQIDLPKTCTDILSADTCTKLEQFAAQLKLDAKQVLAIVQKYASEGVTDAKELYAKVVVYLGELSCAKVLGADRCKKIADFAAKLKLNADQMMAVVKKAAESGITDAKELYAKIVKYMSELTCAKVLGAERCDRLHKLADLLSLKFEKVVLKLKEYYEKGVTEAKELFKKLVAYIKGTIFGDEVETAILEKRGVRNTAKAVVEKMIASIPNITAETRAKIQAKFDELMKSKKEMALRKFILDLISKYFPHLQSDEVPMELDFESDETPMEVMDISLKDFKCSASLQLLLSAEFCKNLEDMALKLQLTYDEVLEIIKNVKDVVTDVKQMYEEIKKFMNTLSCTKILGADKCNRLEMFADLVGVNLHAVVMKLKELYASGITSVTDLYKKVVEWITGIFGDELQAEGFFGDFLKEKLKAIVEKLKELPGLTKELVKQIQAKVDELVNSGSFKAIAKYIKDLFEKYFP